MLALAEYRALVHDRCGGYLPETTSAANEGRYRASAPHRCHRCTAIAEAAGPYSESPHPQALLYPIEHRGSAGDGAHGPRTPGS